jgi:hypothetical protein
VGSLIETWTAGSVVDVAVDLGGAVIWFRVSGGNWNNSGTANPATGTGGVSLSTMTGVGSTAYYPAATWEITNDEYT